MRSDFAVFILTHGRADRVRTYRSLMKAGYTGDLFLILDDEDDQIDLYREKFPDKIQIFNKAEIAKRFDLGDNFTGKMGAIIFARNACFDIAEKLGKRYFIQLDDDYITFDWRFSPDYEYKHKQISKIDLVFEAMVDYLASMDCATLAMAQGGDFIGGKRGEMGKAVRTKRKAMNTFICDTKRRFWFVGRINEDVNTYVRLGSMGKLLLTINNVSITQTQTQKTKGGMTGLYLDSGTYIKSFYSVMYNPSCVKISILRDRMARIHHFIEWEKAVPKILEEKWSKLQ